MNRYWTYMQVRYMLEGEWDEHRMRIPFPTIEGALIILSIVFSVFSLGELVMSRGKK